MKYKLVPRTEGQRGLIEALQRSVVMFIEGPAGTGKTHIAVSHAVEQMGSDAKKIIFCRPLVSASSHIGYLPGDLGEKCAPYMVPLFDELRYHYSTEMISISMAGGSIEVVPLGMMRGRNFHRAVVICDEAQNATYKELHLLLTRIGRHTKMILTGDSSQTDLPESESGAFMRIAEKLSAHELVSHVTLDQSDIVRSQIAKDIEQLLRR